MGFLGSFATSSFTFTEGAGFIYTDKLTVTGLDVNLASTTQSDAVAVDLAFGQPDALSPNIGGTGSLTGIRSHFRGFFYTDTGAISWGGPVTVNFADGSALELKMDDISLSGINGVATGSGNLTMTVEQVASVPEPLTLSMFGAGLAGMAALRRRKRKA